jgi:hypothetical protein
MKTLAIATLAAIGGLVLAVQAYAQSTKTEERPSPLIGRWADILTMGRPGPAKVTTITINEDGTYHWLDIEIDPGKSDLEDPTSYLPDGADVQHSTGWIDLNTGKEKISEEDRKLAVEAVTWSVQDGELHWDMDLGSMGGQGLTFTRIR